MPRNILLSLIIVAAVFAETDQQKIHFVVGARPMRNELRRHIPMGTEIETAKQFMISQGFTCKFKRNDDFLATDTDSTDSKMIQRKDFLYCEHTETAPSAVSKSRRWKTAIVHEESKVTNILVSYGVAEN